MTEWQASVLARVGGFCLDVELTGDGGVLALIGANGSGKTTLLRAIAGAIPVDTAQIVVDGEVLESTTSDVRESIERRRVGYVPQSYGLFPHLSVLDNVAFGLSTGPDKLDRPTRRNKARAMLEDLGCAHLAPRRVRGLSGGEQQRVALARALVLDPRLLLLDEPLAALDATTRRSVRSFLVEHLVQFRRPAMVATHDVRDVEALGATVAVLDAGKVVQHGSLAALRQAPSSEFVAEFVGAS